MMMKYTVEQTQHQSGRGKSTKLIVKLEDNTESAPQYFREHSLRETNLALALVDAANKAGVDVGSLKEAS